MVGPSTRQALNTRALRVANVLHDMAERWEASLDFKVDQELVRDNSSYSEIGNTNDKTPIVVSVKLKDLSNLIVKMYWAEAELRRYAQPSRR